MSDFEQLFLSKVHIPWAQACNPYNLHRALWSFFLDRPDEDRSFLFRVERLQRGIGADVILQSQWEPEHLTGASRLLDSKQFKPALQEGQRLRFRLRANPIKTIKDQAKASVQRKGKIYSRTCRVPLLREEEQSNWLERKLCNVAQLETVLIEQEMPLFFHKNKGTAGFRGKIQPVRFDGILQVTDPFEFLNLIHQGIGPAKAFGCGLVSVARA